MKRLLMLACASGISLCAAQARAEGAQYSQPVAGTLLAQAPTQGGSGTPPFATLCRNQCVQTAAACRNNINRNANDNKSAEKSCSDSHNACIQGCH